jgi:hypothetical protein
MRRQKKKQKKMGGRVKRTAACPINIFLGYYFCSLN